MDEERYVAALEELTRVTAAELSAARHDAVALRRALARFFKRGADSDFSTGELVDFLGVSCPSILERADFSDDEAARAMDLVGELTDGEIAIALL